MHTPLMTDSESPIGIQYVNCTSGTVPTNKHYTAIFAMNRLLEIGFELAGHWLLGDDQKLSCKLLRHSAQANILYAFVRNGEVMYVGKTVRTLSARMAGYRNPNESQTTNVNNNRRIFELLSKGDAIDILALPDNGLLHYGRFHVNLAAALEDDIIRKLNPPWNRGKAEAFPENLAQVPAPSVTEPATLQTFNEDFKFKLQPTYFRTGFFNVGVSAQKLIGSDGETIELFLGDNAQPVLGTINRTANTNGTPRVMGGTAVRDWFQLHAKELDEIAVSVHSPTSLRLKVQRA